MSNSFQKFILLQIVCLLNKIYFPVGGVLGREIIFVYNGQKRISVGWTGVDGL